MMRRQPGSFTTNLVLVCLVAGMVAMLAVYFQNISEKTTDPASHGRENVNAPEREMPTMPAGNNATGTGNALLSITEEQTNALSGLMRRIQDDPTDTNALVDIGKLFLNIEDWIRAEFFLNKAAISRPADVQIRRMLGITQARQDKAEAAAKTFEGLLAFKEDTASRLELARLYKKQLGNPQKAAELLQKVLETPGVDAELLEEVKKEIKSLQQ